MKNLFVFSQNVKLSFLGKIANKYNNYDTNIFLTTHLLFENEKEYISSLFSNCIFRYYAEFLTDEEMSRCDTDAFLNKSMNYDIYLKNIKTNKNKIVISKVINDYCPDKKIVLSKDLGIDYLELKKRGFRFIKADYYYVEPIKEHIIKNLIKFPLIERIYIYRKKKHHQLDYRPDEVFVSNYKDKKIVFIGKMNRIDYRLNIPFTNSELECKKLNDGYYETKEKCIYLTTWHEHGKLHIPDNLKYSVRWCQDGYLPPNYSHKDYFFKPDNVIYYCWDYLGTLLFKNQKLPHEIIPFRKKIYLPVPIFPKKIKKVLIVASGSGDWTALKNRSDDDLLVDAFIQIAKKFPDIHFVYRCHPTWVSPLNVGVNSINRVNQYFKWQNLSNLSLSSNIPINEEQGSFQLSFSRNSLEEDLKNSDFVFGEHSISMIDAAFKQIPFCSVNLTRRRNFFIGINELGFPACSSIDEICDVIKNCSSSSFIDRYIISVNKYNEMTDIE